MNYYNEIEPAAVAWLKGLIVAGCIPPGIVDTRSITEVMPGDLRGFTQCHFFAGIGGWSLALALAGWRADEPVWTGSCPCQPYSTAGAGNGDNDSRALWWAFRWLISQCQPAEVFGEQVASKDGRRWLDGVRTDLEALGYGFGAADLCAAGVSAPQRRQRLYWMAHRDNAEQHASHGAIRQEGGHDISGCCPDGRMAHSFSGRREGFSRGRQKGITQPGNTCWDEYIWTPCENGKVRRIKPGIVPLVDGFPGRVELVRGYGNALVPPLAAEFVAACMEVLA